MEIASIRAQIDEVDGQLAKLFEKRINLVTDLAALKTASVKPILDEDREKKVLENVTSQCSKEIEGEITQLYIEIMRLSRQYQARLAGENNG